MSNLNINCNKQFGMTLGGKAKEYEWSYDGEKITIYRKFVKYQTTIKSEFTNKELSDILAYIKKKGSVELSNNISKLQGGIEKEGIGRFIYENIKKDISLAQAASQLVSILVNAKILGYNGKKRSMEFWLLNENWEKAIINI